MPHGEFLFESLDKLKNVKLAPNPCKINFLGKEIIVSRYNYLKKIK